jgi:16S rRNA (uracil1498-N3)-methyltransferase
VLGEQIVLSNDQSHYLMHVMRLEIGDTCSIFNNRNGEWRATLISCAGSAAVLLVEECMRSPAIKVGRLHLFMSCIRKNRLEWVVEKAVELGVTSVTFIQADRSLRYEVPLQRFERIADQALQQSNQLARPALSCVSSLDAAFKRFDPCCRPICLHVGEEAQLARDLTIEDCDTAYGLFIGPEGGWTLREDTLFHSLSIKKFSLGDSILRAETAAITGVATLNCLLAQACY